MANIEHEALAYGEGHVIHFAEYANATLREAATGLTSGDDYKVALQTDDHSLWILTDYSGPTWVALGTPGDDTVTGSKIVDDAVDSEHYTDGSIDKAHLSADCVDGTKIADEAIDSEHYTDGSIDAAHLATNAVETAKIKNANVTAAKIGTGAVTNAKIGADAVDDTKIGDDKIKCEHINSNVAATGVTQDANGALNVTGIVETGANAELKVKVIEIGDWNMDATPSVEIAHGLTLANIRTISVLIRNDDDIICSSFGDTFNDAGATYQYTRVDATNVKLNRSAGGYFDSASYDVMGDDGNRGWITIIYQA